jgi:adenylate cyclase
MNLEQLGRFRIMVRQVVWIAIFWTILGALDALNTHAISNGIYIQRTEQYNFSHYFWVNTLGGTVAGIISGSFLIFFLRERFRSKSFGFALVVNSVVIASLNFALSAAAYNLYLSVQTGRGVFSPQVLEETAVLMRNSYYVKNLLFWSIVVVLTIIGLHVNEKYGPGVLTKLILGRYHHPREEERIFMFVDIKSSTTIAERLGHIRFFNLLNDFFRDITNPILYSSGEISQYVGDEVVISWTIKDGVRNANCVRCFNGMLDAIQNRAMRYRRKYGLVPEFKAGLHCGIVTTGEIGVIKKDIVFSGDVMNTASRIQSVCNQYGVRILLSKYLLDKLNLPPNSFHPQRVGSIELKGKRNKVELYTLEEFNDAEDENRFLAPSD